MRPFLAYYHARVEEHKQEFLFRTYIADTLQMMGERKYPVQRYSDLLKPVDPRTGDEVAADIISELGLSFRIDE